MYVYNSFRSDSIRDHVVCSCYVGFCLFERQIKTTALTLAG